MKNYKTFPHNLYQSSIARKKTSKNNLNIVFSEDILIDSRSEINLSDIDGIVVRAVQDTYQYLSKFRFDAEYTEKLETAFGNNFDGKVANKLFDKFAKGNFTAIPTIKIVNRNDINGANGAFSQDTNLIYLASEFITQNVNNLQAITDVLLEETGHFIDAQINTKDTPGDEGEIFAILVQGNSLSQQELAFLRAEDDTATVTLDGQVVEIEQNAQATSQFITLAKPITPSTTVIGDATVIGDGSNQEDIIQLQSYNATEGGLVQKVWGYGGADIFNVTFETPGDGKVGIDFKTGKLQALATMLVEPDWGVREKRLAMDMSMAIASTTIDYAASAASNAASSIPFGIGGAIATGINTASTAAQLALELGNIGGNYDLDIEEYNNSKAGINDFFAEQNKSDWGTVNVLQSRTIVEIRDFQAGVDIITLPDLPTNWNWTIGSGTFSDTAKIYASIGYSNGTNGASELLRIGFEDNILQQIDNIQDLINNLLVKSNSGWAIGDTFKTKKSTLNSVLNGTVVNDVLYIESTNNFSRVTLSGGLGDDILEGRNNAQIDELNGGPGNDYIIPGAGQDVINGGDGYDRVDYSNLTAGVNTTSSTFTSIESIVGTIYNDTLDFSSLAITNSDNLVTGLISIKGNNGADRLTGSQYSDLLDGGAGIDTLIGGTGNDTYIIDNQTETITENAGQGNDTIKSSVTFSLANLSNIENLTLIGTAAINGTGNIANNLIKGNSANNTLNSGAGNDTLDGGDGSDTLIGSLGNDIYYVDNSSDQITELANEGTETVNSSVSWIIGNNLENLTLTGTAAINGTGNAANNLIIGNTANNNLVGSDGNDTLIGGTGNDTLNGGSGEDTADYSSATQGIDVTLGGSGFATNDGFGNQDSLTGIDHIIGSQYDDRIVGDEYFNNTLLGGAGNDFLDGLGGNDSLIGGDGNDYLIGRAGIDTLIGGLGDDRYLVTTTDIDIIIENLGQGTDEIASSISFSVANLANIENLSLIGENAINGTGNAANNGISGSMGNNILNGGDGNDDLSGSGGFDTLIGGNGDDTYSIMDFDTGIDIVTENLGGGTDTIRSNMSFSLANLPNIENLTLLFISSINGTGNAANNLITGNIANNNLIGGDGNDTLIGGDGIDTLLGGGGEDIADYSSATQAINVTIGGSGFATNDGFGNQDSLSGIDHITGSQYNDTIVGDNFWANTLQGGAGNDSLNGLGANDTLIGGTGLDTLWGAIGDDSLNGEEGNDWLTGELGRDTVKGGDGNDTVYGGWEANPVGDSANDTLWGDAGDDYLNGEPGSDNLNGGIGNDTLIGGIGNYNDILTGGGGSDRFTFNSRSEGIDGITDFDVINDTIVVSAAGFGGGLVANAAIAANQFALGTSPTTSSQRFLYEQSTGSLFFDQDGTSAIAKIQIATLNTGLSLTNADIFVVA